MVQIYSSRIGGLSKNPNLSCCMSVKLRMTVTITLFPRAVEAALTNSKDTKADRDRKDERFHSLPSQGKPTMLAPKPKPVIPFTRNSDIAMFGCFNPQL